MARTESKCCITFLFVLIMLTMTMNYVASHEKEEEGQLLSFKASINDPLHHLSDWVITSSSSSICHWNGVTCDNNSHVRAINLSGKNISSYNISSSVFQLPHVEHIDLSDNLLSGGISFSLSSLLYLNLSNNNFTGPVPLSFSRIQILDLSNNMFSGEIPHQIGSLTSLRYVDLGGNVLVGKIPDSVTNMTGLEYLTLASNQLVGEIPPKIGLMKSLKWIYFGYNNLSGEIPERIGELKNLSHLDLVYNKLTGHIPDSLGNLTNLEYLFLYQNKLTGRIPRSIFELRKLVSLDLSDNFLSGEIPELVIQLQRLEILHLFSNNFTGKIPNAITSLPRLQVLQLWSNGLTGEIPEDLGKHSNLTVLDLSTNKLSGKIPDSLCHSGALYKLILFSNSLQGELPNSLTSCTSLRRVRLQNNKFSGGLPSRLTQLPQVYLLDISGNQLSGRIDDRKWNMLSLQMLNLGNNNFSGELPTIFGSTKLEKLDISENRFSGNIPRGLGSLSELMQLNLSNNKLYGEIPQELTSCRKLVLLDVSHNQLTGQIPTSLGDMPVLSLLDLSDNQFWGKIPENLGRVESLVLLNISHNHFHGHLPTTGAFLAINASAVTGNDLCGGSGGLPPCKRGDKNPWFVVLWFAVGFAGFALAAFLFTCSRRRNSLELKRVENEDGTWEIQFFDSKFAKSIAMDDILSSAKAGHVISKGKNWVSYEGKCMASGMQFEVKEIRDLNSVPLSFWEDLTELGKLRHPNIFKLMGLCRSGKGAFLVYEDAEGKSLSQVVKNLSWESRRKIAVGIAKALKFLQAQCSSVILVGDMSPESIIVDGNDIPRLKLSPPALFKGSISSPYLAPEVRNGKEVTEKSDVYGFGVILIELLTGRRGLGTEEEGSIVEWARFCYSDCHWEAWVDPTMKGGKQNDVVEAMNLALHCTAMDPTARPCASVVFKALSAVTCTHSVLCVPPLQP
ncbi:hypothetical protein K1719_022089 [Acacia pycnantha]|nr:hypothetical protein K1719_022089 [Acacia pycnantha]